MLIATATLITILLLGTGIEQYFIESFEQGIKKEVVDKSRKKEIKSLLSDYNKGVKAYNMARNSYLKDLQELTQGQYTTMEDFQSLADGLDSITINHQQYAFETRLSIGQLLTEEEWNQIILNEKERMLKAYDKSGHKASKDPMQKHFAKLDQFIDDSDMHELDRIEARENLNLFKDALDQLNNYYHHAQLEYNDLIFNQHCSEQEFMQIFERYDELRNNSYSSLVNMHYTMSNNTSEKEWAKFIGQIKKKV